MTRRVLIKNTYAVITDKFLVDHSFVYKLKTIGNKKVFHLMKEGYTSRYMLRVSNIYYY